VTVFPDELYPAPPSWAETAYPELVHYNRSSRVGTSYLRGYGTTHFLS
jgi:hypothetical protein